MPYNHLKSSLSFVGRKTNKQKNLQLLAEQLKVSLPYQEFTKVWGI